MRVGRALSLAVHQLSDPACRRVLFLGIGLSLIVFAALAALTVVGIHYVPATPWHWLDDLVALGGAVGFLIAMWLLFPAVVSMFVGVLLDDVAEAVERRYYPDDPPGRAPSLMRAMMLSVRLMLVLVVLNILVLPLYIVTFFVPFLSLGIYLVLNGYLLGREYFELVATRHMTPREATMLRRFRRGRVFVAGLVVAGLFAIPIVNLLAPIVGAAFMMHVYKGLPGSERR